MRYSIAIIAAVTAAGLCVAGCKKNVREAPRVERQDAIFVTWEFSSADRDGDPYTEAALIINGSREHRHRIGVFYGRVRKILSPGEINREMMGGTISGFVTNHQGRGSEVIVRYNEQVQRLIDAAVVCLNRVGLAATTTELVRREAGVSRGAMLHHFPSTAEEPLRPEWTGDRIRDAGRDHPLHGRSEDGADLM